LAFGADKPVLPIDTLMAVAEDARTLAGAVQRVWVVMDARMDEVYAAQYEQASDRWSVVDAPRLTNPQALQALWRAEPPQAVAGSALDAFGERLDTGGALRVAAARPRAAAMLPLARALWLAGGAVDAALALPLYVRDRVALTTLERDAARSAKLAAESAR
jgi:tRNA threonylcarbamoyladenosine biosynthesis protein TsaB